MAPPLKSTFDALPKTHTYTYLHTIRLGMSKFEQLSDLGCKSPVKSGLKISAQESCEIFNLHSIHGPNSLVKSGTGKSDVTQ